MTNRHILRAFALALCLLGAPAPASAQHDADVAAAPAQARQFDFLLGQWELEVKPKVSSLAAMIHGAPKLVGTWKAWPGLDGFGVEDELRIVDNSGNPTSLNHAMRAYDRGHERWNIVALDVYRGSASTSTAQWQDGEMRVSGSGIDPEGKPYLTRTRYAGISADGFRMSQDRSFDNGQTWDEATLVIDAKRVVAAAPR